MRHLKSRRYGQDRENSTLILINTKRLVGVVGSLTLAIRAIGKYISSLGWQLSGNIVRAQGHAVKRRKKEKKKTLPKCHSTSFCLLAAAVCYAMTLHSEDGVALSFMRTPLYLVKFFFSTKKGEK